MDNVNYEELFGTAAEETTDTLDPAEEAQEQTTETQDEFTEEQTQEGAQKHEQSREERSRQAFARRIREAEERGARAQRERDSALIAEMQLVDPDDESKKIDDVDKAKEFLARQRKARLDACTPTEADIQHIVREQMEKAKQPQVNPVVQAQLEQIARMDPAMKDLGAILNSDIGEAFRGFVDRGDDFVTAFYKAGKLQEQVKSKAAEADKAKASSKGHLSSTKQQGAGALSVPSDEMALFRELMPGATEAEIQKYYNADRQKFGPK